MIIIDETFNFVSPHIVIDLIDENITYSKSIHEKKYS